METFPHREPPRHELRWSGRSRNVLCARLVWTVGSSGPPQHPTGGSGSGVSAIVNGVSLERKDHKVINMARFSCRCGFVVEMTPQFGGSIASVSHLHRRAPPSRSAEV